MNWKAIVNVPGAVGDDARRRRLLNYILVAVLVSCIPMAIITAILLITETQGADVDRQGNSLVLFGSLITFCAILVIYGVNRYYSGWVSGWVFILLLIALATFGDTPEEVTTGRSTFIFTLPILISSVILMPRSTFITAFICSLAITALSGGINTHFNPTAVFGFMILSLVAWLAASSLENALHELHVINQELDQRVALRTHELSEALSLVQTESSKREAILESIADGVVVFDSSGRVEIANDSFGDMFDISTREILGKDIAAASLEHIIKADDLKRGEKVSHTKFNVNGKTISASIAPVALTLDSTGGMVTVFRDFTREEQLNRMKDSFVSMASHELRTPLNAIIGYSDMLLQGVYGDLSEDQNHITDRVMANSKRMLSMVNNMLDQASFVEGRLSLHIAPFDISDLVNEADVVLSVLARGKGLEFACTAAENFPPSVMGDHERLLQILINLGGNAIKFTQQGSVKIDIAQAGDKHWQLQVKDTGNGISKADQKRIFEPFEQVGDTYTREQGGTGLGLAIVKTLVELMGGEISLKSKPGEGSTFTIQLPLQVIEKEVNQA